MTPRTPITGEEVGHTPGPWSVITEDHDISVDGEGWFEDQHVNGWIVVGNPEDPSMAIAVIDTGYLGNWNESLLDNNAALVAAAPSLRDACAAAEDFLATIDSDAARAIYAQLHEALRSAATAARQQGEGK